MNDMRIKGLGQQPRGCVMAARKSAERICLVEGKCCLEMHELGK